MTRRLILFNPDQSIHEAKTFIKYRISGGPVVSKAGDLVGIISEADCMKKFLKVVILICQYLIISWSFYDSKS